MYLSQYTDLEEARKELQRRVDTARTKAQKRNEMIDRLTKMYFLVRDRRSNLDNEDRIVLNDPMNIIDMGRSILASNEMKLRAYRLDQNQQNEETATQVEKFLRGCFYVNNERSEQNLQDSIAFDLLLKTGAVVRTFWEESYHPTTGMDEMAVPTQQFQELPVYMDVLPLKNVYYKAGGRRGRWQYIMYAEKRTVADIEDEWPDVDLGIVSGKDETDVDYVDYWGWAGDQVENAILANNVWVKPPTVEPGYSDIPYTIFFGKSTTSSEIEEMSLGLLSASENSIRDMEKLLERKRRITNTYAAMPLVVYHKPGSEPPQVDPILSVVNLEQGEDLKFPVWPGSPPDVKEDLAFVQGKIQEGSFPSVAYGEGKGASGYATNMLAEAGRSRLGQYQKGLELGYTIICRKILALAQNFAPNQMLPVYGRHRGEPFFLQITGAEMAGFRVDVSLRPRYPQDDMRKTTQAIQLKSSQLLSDRTIWDEFLDYVEHPDEEIKRKLVEEAMREPSLKQAAIQQAMEAWGIPVPPPQPEPQPWPAPQTIAQNVGAQAMAGMPPMQPSQPGLSPGMPNPMGGMAPPQELGYAPPGQENPMLMAQVLNYLRGTQ